MGSSAALSGEPGPTGSQGESPQYSTKSLHSGWSCSVGSPKPPVSSQNPHSCFLPVSLSCAVCKNCIWTKIRGPIGGFLELLLCVTPCSCYPGPQVPAASASLLRSLLFSQLSETARASPPPPRQCPRLKAIHPSRAHLMTFSSLRSQILELPVIQCLKTVTSCFMPAFVFV